MNAQLRNAELAIENYNTVAEDQKDLKAARIELMAYRVLNGGTLEYMDGNTEIKAFLFLESVFNFILTDGESSEIDALANANSQVYLGDDKPLKELLHKATYKLIDNKYDDLIRHESFQEAIAA